MRPTIPSVWRRGWARSSGGPRSYTERFGDYDRMVSRHLGRALSEEQRARWVRLPCRSADDAGLPTDPEWRAVRRVPRVGLADRARELAAGRPAAAPHAGSTVVVGCERDARLESLGARRAAGRNSTPTSYPGPTRNSASRSTSSRSSVSGIAGRCASRSTSGRTMTAGHADAILAGRAGTMSCDGAGRRTGGRPRAGSTRGRLRNGAKGEAVADEPTIHRFPAEHEGAFVNAYLVESDAGVVAVDGLPTVSAAKEMRIALDRLGSRFTRCW